MNCHLCCSYNLLHLVFKLRAETCVLGCSRISPSNSALRASNPSLYDWLPHSANGSKTPQKTRSFLNKCCLMSALCERCQPCQQLFPTHLPIPRISFPGIRIFSIQSNPYLFFSKQVQSVKAFVLRYCCDFQVGQFRQRCMLPEFCAQQNASAALGKSFQKHVI